jgi:hypothetical protein
MDFERVSGLLTDFLEAGGVPFAVIGGIALAALGMPRTTLDLDLAVDGVAQDDLIAFLESLGYETLHRSSGYSNHLHPMPDLGRVDLVYLRGETCKRVLGQVQRLVGPAGRMLPVPRTEHLAAMKAFAIRNDRSRRLRELADIRFLLQVPGTDRTEVEGYLRRYGLEEEIVELDERT